MQPGVKRNTKRVGDYSEIMVLAALVRAGYFVSIPYGENRRYDLIADKDGVLNRIQVKTGRLRNGAIVFNCYSSHGHRGGSSRLYTGEVDYFAVYCAAADSVYLVPSAHVTTHRGALRVEPARNGQLRKLRWASAYLLAQGGTEMVG